MKLAELITQSATKLETAGVYSPRADAEIIVSKILNIPRADLPEKAERALSKSEMKEITDAMARREKREPVARIFDGTAFCGLPIRLEEGVFEPLAESESLIEHALLFLQARGLPSPERSSGSAQAGGNPRILDIGTGTGCLLLSLLAALPQASGVGVDIGESAIDLARRNAENLRLAGRVTFKVNDWMKDLNGPFDLIISNPPFIPRRLIKGLVPEVRMHDPVAGLEGGRDGMRYYRKLAAGFPKLAAPGAMGLFQVSLTFADQVKTLFLKTGFKAEIKRNYLGIPVGISIMDRAPADLRAKLNRLICEYL